MLPGTGSHLTVSHPHLGSTDALVTFSLHRFAFGRMVFHIIIPFVMYLTIKIHAVK